MFSPRDNTGLKTRDRRSMFSAGSRRSSRRSGIFSQSGVGNMSHILDETNTHALKKFGACLPVLVAEVLNRTDRTSEVSVKLSASGWAWCVSSRRLFIWRYKQLSGSKFAIPQCRELTLPPSDLAHRADLVTVFTAPNAQVSSCIAVSPEGTVRYWPSIAHEGLSVEINAELQGQECDSLIDVCPIGCILATTTSTVVLIYPHISAGQHSIQCHQLKPQQGVLGDIGKRVSSLFFGSMLAPSTEAKLVRVVSVPGQSDDEKIIYVLAGHSLHKWWLAGEEMGKLVYECDMEQFVKEHFSQSLWSQDASKVTHVQMWFIDMQPTPRGLRFLVAATNPHVSKELYYALGDVDIYTGEPPETFSTFSLLKPTPEYNENQESVLLGYRFLSIDDMAYIYNKKTIMPISILNPAEDNHPVEFKVPSDQILGAGVCEDIPIFFSSINGLVALGGSGQYTTNMSLNLSDMSMSFDQTTHMINSPNTSDVTAMMFDSPSLVASTSQMFTTSAPDKLHNRTLQHSEVEILKTAFLHYCKQNQSECSQMVAELLSVLAGTADSIDRLVCKFSEDIMDDYPASDPRWATKRPQAADTTSTISLFLLRQLEGKLKSYEWYIKFLQDEALWTKLHSMLVEDQQMATIFLLQEHAEKLITAITMRSLHSKYSSILDDAVIHVLNTRGDVPQGQLTHQDLFYREVSKIDDIFPSLYEQEMGALSNMPPKEFVKQISHTNSLIMNILQNVLQFRQQKRSTYLLSSELLQLRNVSWTTRMSDKGVLGILKRQHKLTLDYGVKVAEDAQTRAAYYQQLVDLTDLILEISWDQFKYNTADPDRDVLMQQFESDRQNLITPFLKEDQFERAASLAEKHQDFEILVQICEQTKDQERLNEYMEKFKEQGFSDFVFEWFWKAGKHGRLLSQPRTRQPDVQKFLSHHNSLSWLNSIQQENYSQSARTLLELAENEKDLLSKKKTYLSLSKLALYAASELYTEQQDLKIDSELNLIQHQEQIPEKVLDAYSICSENMHVMTPEQLIELYISEENRDGSEMDFMKALELLKYVDTDEESIERIRLHIWCQALLRNQWDDIDMDNPIQSSQHTVFFKMVEILHLQGLNIPEFLPSKEVLLAAPELGDLKNNPGFQYLIQAGYEQIQVAMEM